MPSALLSNGRRMWFDEGTAPETIRNSVERAENRLAQQRAPERAAGAIAAGIPPSASYNEEQLKGYGPEPAPPPDPPPTPPFNAPTGERTAFHKATGGLFEPITHGRYSSIPLRSASNLYAGLTDLVAPAYNIGARYLTGDKNTPRMPSVSETINQTVGVAPQPANASRAEQIAEALLSINPKALLGSFGRQGGDDAGRLVTTTATPLAERGTRTVLTPTQNLTGQTVTATGSVYGADAGQKIAEAAGVDPELGAVVGGIVLGAGGSAAQQGIVRPLTQGVFSREGGQSAELVRAADEQGITPRPVFTGNAGLSRMANIAASWPIFGAAALRRGTETFRQFEQALRDWAAAVGREERPGFLEPNEIESRNVVGTAIGDAARAGMENQRGYFREGYRLVDEGVPEDLVVEPTQARRAAAEIATPGTGYAGSTGEEAPRIIEDNMRSRFVPVPTQGPPAPVPPGPPGPMQPEPPAPAQGVLYPDVRPIGTKLFYRSDAAQPVDQRAQDQIRAGLREDKAEALLADPRVTNPQERIERERVLARERAAMEDPSRNFALPATLRPPGAHQPGDPGVDIGGGGDYLALERMGERAQTGEQRFNQYTTPDYMAVLQRDAAEHYPDIAGSTLMAKAKAKTERAGVNVSPLAFAQWWNSLDQNAKQIMSAEDINDTPVTRQNLDALQQLASAIHEGTLTENKSGTAAALMPAYLGAGAMVSPEAALGTSAAMLAASRGLSSEALARLLGRTPQEALQLAGQRGIDAGVATGGILSDVEARRLRALPSFTRGGPPLRDYLNSIPSLISKAY